jgi:hypothetical protein
MKNKIAALLMMVFVSSGAFAAEINYEEFSTLLGDDPARRGGPADILPYLAQLQEKMEKHDKVAKQFYLKNIDKFRELEERTRSKPDRYRIPQENVLLERLSVCETLTSQDSRRATEPLPPQAANPAIKTAIENFITGPMKGNEGQRLPDGGREFLNIEGVGVFARYRNGADGNCGLYVLGVPPNIARKLNYGNLRIPSNLIEFGNLLEPAMHTLNTPGESVDAYLLACVANTYEKNIRIWDEAGTLLVQSLDNVDAETYDILFTDPVGGSGHYERLIFVGDVTKCLWARIIEDATTDELDNVARGDTAGYEAAQMITISEAIQKFAGNNGFLVGDVLLAIKELGGEIPAELEALRGLRRHPGEGDDRHHDVRRYTGARHRGAGYYPNPYPDPHEAGAGPSHHGAGAGAGGWGVSTAAHRGPTATAGTTPFNDKLLSHVETKIAEGIHNNWALFYSYLYTEAQSNQTLYGTLTPHRGFLIGYNSREFIRVSPTDRHAMNALFRAHKPAPSRNITALQAIDIWKNALKYPETKGMHFSNSLEQDMITLDNGRIIWNAINNTLFTGGDFGINYERRATREEFNQILDALEVSTKNIGTLAELKKMYWKETRDPLAQQHQRNMFLCAAMMWGKNHGESAFDTIVGIMIANLSTDQDEIIRLQTSFNSKRLLSDSEIEELRNPY